MSLLQPNPTPRPKKFIPDGDMPFALRAEAFLSAIEADPKIYHLTQDDVEQVREAVVAYQQALKRTGAKGCRTPGDVRGKNEARAVAEKLLRRIANVIRADAGISSTAKLNLGIPERPVRPVRQPLPELPPTLAFMNGVPGAHGKYKNGTGRHVLMFYSPQGRKTRAKPQGAARLEVFVDFVPPGEPIPQHPAQRSGRAWYVRSFTTNPMTVEFPMPLQPMMVVYWGRWADSAGNVGRFSTPCMARVEGWSDKSPEHLLEDAGGRQIETKYVYMQMPVSHQLPDGLPGDALAAACSSLLNECLRLPGAGAAHEAVEQRLLE